MNKLIIIGIIVLLVFITGCTTEGIPERACIKQTEKNGSTYYDLFLGACEDFKEIIYVNVTKYVDRPIVKEVVRYEKCGECPDCTNIECDEEENKMDEELIEERKVDDEENDEDKDEEEEEAIDDETDEDEDGE